MSEEEYMKIPKKVFEFVLKELHEIKKELHEIGETTNE